TRVFTPSVRFRSRLSPDGTWFATQPAPSADHPASATRLVVAPVGSGESHTLSFDADTQLGDIAWLPDSSAVMFVQTVKGRSSLAKVKRGSQSVETITDLVESGDGLAVSPDGQTAMLSMKDDARGSRLRFVNLATGTSRDLETKARVGIFINWSP